MNLDKNRFLRIHLELSCNRVQKQRNPWIKHIQETEYMFVVRERFISDSIKIHGKHYVSTEDGDIWYPQACNFLDIDHHLYSFYEKGINEKTI